MNTKRLLKMMILLTVVVAVTVGAAVAQEQPAPKTEDRVVVEPGESGSPAANMSEVESNNTMGLADWVGLGDVVSGKIGTAGDQDYFRLNVPNGTWILIDVDAQSQGSALDAEICLFDKDGNEMACNDDAHGRDPLLMDVPDNYTPIGYQPHYVRVREYNHGNEGGNAYTYKLSVYRPLLVSTASNGTVAGVPYMRHDILSHFDFWDGTQKWMLFFDASDVGVTSNVVGLAGNYYGGFSLVLATAQDLWVSGALQKVKPWDVLWFEPSTSYCGLGPSTCGAFRFEYRGSTYGLTTANEKLDALATYFWVSTVGRTIHASTQVFEDEDIFNLPYGFSYFDGSAVPGLAVEDIYAADYNYSTPGPPLYHFTILGTGRVDGVSVNQKKIFSLNPATNRVTGIYFNGPSHGLKVNIDAFDSLD